MDNKLSRKYGLFTAICMVVGIVIGSGVFFKAQTILQKTGGNMPLGILAWIIGGAIMLVCLLTFAVMGQKYEKVNGLVDYAEATVGPRYGYYMGWFASVIYYPAMTSALCWLSARYTLVFLTSVNPDFPLLIPADQGGCIVGPECLALMMFYMACAYAVNALSPKLAGKFQTSTTVIKFIPLTLMAVVGIIYGLMNGTLTENFSTVAYVEAAAGTNPLFASVSATAFAYEGWIIATSINSELKDAKKNLPKALIIGGIIIVITYIAYYVGVAGGATNQELIDQGATIAFVHTFGNVLGNVLNLFIAISCMGTMNGLMLGCSRGLYSIAARGQGPAHKIFAQVDKNTDIPNNSAVFALFITAFWGLYFYLSNLAGTMNGLVCFQGTAFESVAFVFDSTELPIITIYAMYLPMFICWMKKEKSLGTVKRFVLPILAFAGSCFMVLACLIGHKMENFWYIIVYIVVMLLGAFFEKRNMSKQ